MSVRDRLCIMVVDDMSTSRGLITHALESMGIRHVATATDGRSALGALARRPVHLVISDYNMPGMDGLHLLHCLRQAPRTARIGFLLITGRADQQIVDQGRRLGMNNYLAKPFSPADLKGAIEAVVGRL
jgi:two-component system chemotaxis response regulator CheY